MSVFFTSLGLVVAIAGCLLLLLEFAHPGALLMIPGTILLVGGLLYILLPDVLLNTPWGLVIIFVAAIVATLAEIPLYRYIAPVHGPLTSTSAGFAGRTGILVAPVVPYSLKGKVRLGSEIWSAQSDAPIPAGTRVRVVSGEGVSVWVVPEPADERKIG